MLDLASPVSLVVTGPELPVAYSPRGSDRIAQQLRLEQHSETLVLEGLSWELIGLVTGIEKRIATPFVPSWLLRAKEMLEDCASRDLTIAELAACSGVHPVYLARAYRRHFACSPGEYLRRCRILRVLGLLSGTDLPLVQIALQCGFSDQSQMTRTFSKTFGIPPARYRRLRRQ
jgi:AraC family transcriptional regulator